MSETLNPNRTSQNIEFETAIRLPVDSSLDWPRYRFRGYDGGFHYTLLGHVVVPIHHRLDVYLHGRSTPVATGVVESVELCMDHNSEPETIILFSDVVPYA